MIVNTDIDIDVADRDRLLKLIKNTPATIVQDKRRRKHNTGVYFHEIPTDPITELATVDYKRAEELGYFKIDVLNVNLYKDIKTTAQLDSLLEMEPMWELLMHKEVVQQLFHIHAHYDIVSKMKPQSIAQLAAVLAVIRPAKRHLIGKDWNTVFASVWERPANDEYYFKKAHAISYATAIVLQMNMLVTDFS